MNHFFQPFLILGIILGNNSYAQTANLTPVSDNSIYSDNVSNSSGVGQLYSGQTCGSGTRRALLKFNLSSIPAGSIVNSVTLQVNVNNVSAAGGSDTYTIHPLTTAFGEGTSNGGGTGASAVAPDVTWNDAILGTTWITAGGDFSASISSVLMNTLTGSKTFPSSASFSTLVQTWLDTPSLNFGIIMIGNESNSCTARRFGSKDQAIAPILIINFTAPPCSPTTGTDVRTECDSLFWIDGNTYHADNNSATFNIVGGATSTCDSLVTLNLTIINSSSGTDTRTACDSLVWIDGNTYYADNNSATFNIIGGAANTCDSLVTLNLTIINSATTTDIRTECDSLVWIDGTTYYADNNTATFTIFGGAANMCDSIITLDLTINNSANSTDTRTECDSLVWIDGNTYYTDNNTATFTISGGAANMCDSIITLDLTISNSATGTDTRTACDSLVWIDGNTYHTSNNSATFNIVGGASNMCDSLVILDLTINNSVTGIDTRIECDSLVWIDGNTYYSDNNSATFNIVGGSANFCDSIVSLNLFITINDLMVTQSGTQLISNATGSTYQWLDCSTMIPIFSETNQVFNATMNGDYSVILETNNCIDTTSCYHIANVGILKNDFGNNLLIYPNPTKGSFSIDLGNKYKKTTITITNMAGIIIQSKSYNNRQLLNITLEESAGLYLLIIEALDKKSVIQLLKE